MINLFKFYLYRKSLNTIFFYKNYETTFNLKMLTIHFQI